MNIKQMSEMVNKIKDGGVSEAEFGDAMETLYSCIDQAKEVVLGKISEKDFVSFCRFVKNAVLSVALVKGNGGNLLFAEMSGELDGLLDAYFLSVLGLLMQEEVL